MTDVSTTLPPALSRALDLLIDPPSEPDVSNGYLDLLGTSVDGDDEVAKNDGAIQAVFMKGHYSAAYSAFEAVDDTGTRLPDWLRQRGVDEIDIAGLATDYCVLATATDAVNAGFATRVLLDLTAGVAQESTDKAVEDMRAAGVEVT